MLQKKLRKNNVSRKSDYDKIGRNFCLVFNRATMYDMDHPYTVQAISEFYKIIHALARAFSAMSEGAEKLRLALSCSAMPLRQAPTKMLLISNSISFSVRGSRSD